MARSAGTITLRFEAGTAGFIADVDKVKAKVREYGQSAKASTAEASAAVRAFEGNLANSNRAVARFLSVTLGLGPALSAAFPVIGAVMLGDAIVQTGMKAAKFFQDMKDAPNKVAQAFRELNAPLRETNDSLAIANARLENDIAKLEKKPENGLKIALLEAVEAANKLADALDKDLSKLDQTIKKQGEGFLGQLLGHGGSGAIEDEIKRFQNQVAGVQNIQGPGVDRQAMYRKLYDDELRKLQGMLEKASGQQQTREAALKGPLQPGGAPAAALNAAAIPSDQTTNIAILKAALQNIQLQRNYVDSEIKRASLGGQKATAEAQAEAARLAKEARDRLRQFERNLDRYVLEHNLTVQSPKGPIEFVSDQEMNRRNEEAGRTAEGYVKALDESLKDKFKEERFDTRELIRPMVAPRPAGYETIEQQRARMESEARLQGINALYERPEQAAERELRARLNIINTIHAREMAILTDEQQKRELMDRDSLAAAQALEDYKARMADLHRQQIEQVSGPIIGGVSNQLANLVTGQKTSFGKTFQGIGHQMVSNAIQNGLKAVTGHFFGKKRDGSSQDAALWVQMAAGGKGGNIPILGPLGGFSIPGGFGKVLGSLGSILGSGSGSGGVFSKILGALIPHAEGGPVSPSSAYLVGESGPEVLTRASGYITSNAELRRTIGGGGNTFGPTIVDARGGELGMEQRVGRAVQLAHDAAVSNSVRAQTERSHRVPQR